MTDYKAFGAWLVLCLATAAITVAGLQVVDKSIGLQQIVAKFGK